MVKTLIALAKYLAWWFTKPLRSRLCCKSHTHAANIKFQPNACPICFKRYFPFLFGGENIHNYFSKSIARSRYFVKSIVSFRCVEDTPGDTLVHALVRDKYSPARWVSRKLGPKSKTIPCYTADCFKSSCLLFVVPMSLFECVWFWNVTPDFVSRNCHATDIALTERPAWLEWLLNHLQW